MVEASSLLLADLPSSKRTAYALRPNVDGERSVYRQRMLINLRLRAATPEIIERYQKGEPGTSLAEAFATSTTRIYQILSRAGIPRRPASKPRAEKCWCGKPAYEVPSEKFSQCRFHALLRRSQLDHARKADRSRRNALQCAATPSVVLGDVSRQTEARQHAYNS
jgi:hypothetical protein